jgi:phosphoesterase RecJ-like protein
MVVLEEMGNQKSQNLWREIIPIIRKGEKFIVTTHSHADGDALGSQLALFYFLTQMGKKVRAINCDEPQRQFLFIDPEKVVETYRPGGDSGDIASCDAWFIVDTSALQRIGSMAELVDKLPCRKIVIDHHVFFPEEAFADINVIDDAKVATGELIFRLGKRLGCTLDKRIGLALYVAIYTDSNAFTYTKVDSDTHRIVAELIDTGVVPYDVFDRLYQNHTACETALFARAIRSLRFGENDRIAWITLGSKAYHNCGADPEGSETYLLNYVRGIRSVELVVLLRQLPGGRVKVSFRSKNFLRVDTIARMLGGGGHWFAAGAVVSGSLPRVREKVRKCVMEVWPEKQVKG